MSYTSSGYECILWTKESIVNCTFSTLWALFDDAKVVKSCRDFFWLRGWVNSTNFIHFKLSISLRHFAVENFLRNHDAMRCDAIRCVALRERLMWWQLSWGIRLKSWTVKVCSTPNLFSRRTILYLTHLLSVYLWRSPCWSRALNSYVGAVQMAAGLWIMHSIPRGTFAFKTKNYPLLFLYFLFCLSLSLSPFLSLCLSLKGLWLLWRLGWSVGMDTALLRSTRRVPHIRNARFAFISAHKMHNSQISI